MKESAGTVFVCATPIGNLEDITLRALRILREVDLIAAEDTRRTRKLLTHYDIHTPMISYHQHNAPARIPKLLDELKAGTNVALVSDAGTPGISDPGQEMIKAAIEAGIAVSPVPGPSAVIAGLISAGYKTDTFLFAGFVPRKGRTKERFLEEICKGPHTTVLYEAPHRLIDTLQALQTVAPQRSLAVCREMTKIHEEVMRGLPGELLEHFEKVRPRGEFVLVLSPQEEQVDGATESEASQEISVKEAILQLMAEGMDKKAAIRRVAEERGLPKRDVYRTAIDIPAGNQP
ncbi:MAG: 16S rRNA (cytidine(1402)-2'-O)-methyltransferase [Firmicutes bacterium]|nr:16S rRNA (cytidine(1402)-2'-O)-methyltransferase [Bacillota bacterium]